MYRWERAFRQCGSLGSGCREKVRSASSLWGAKPVKDRRGRKQVCAERVLERDLRKFQPAQREAQSRVCLLAESWAWGTAGQSLCPCCDVFSRWPAAWEEGKPKQIQRATGGDCQLTRPLVAKWQAREIQVARFHGSRKKTPVMDPLPLPRRSCFIEVDFQPCPGRSSVLPRALTLAPGRP